VETVEYKNISFTVWDVGGQDKVLTQSSVTLTSAIQLFTSLWQMGSGHGYEQCLTLRWH
jgi:hypothetical protein